MPPEHPRPPRSVGPIARTPPAACEAPTRWQVERESALEKARGASLLDAAFFILRFNARRQADSAAEILPSDVWSAFDASAYARAVERARALYTYRGLVTDAFFQYPGVRPYDKVFVEVKTLHPGFSDDCYHAVAADQRDTLR